MATDSEVLDYIEERLEESKDLREQYIKYNQHDEVDIEDCLIELMEHILIKFGREVIVDDE